MKKYNSIYSGPILRGVPESLLSKFERILKTYNVGHEIVEYAQRGEGITVVLEENIPRPILEDLLLDIRRIIGTRWLGQMNESRKKKNRFREGQSSHSESIMQLADQMKKFIIKHKESPNSVINDISIGTFLAFSEVFSQDGDLSTTGLNMLSKMIDKLKILMKEFENLVPEENRDFNLEDDVDDMKTTLDDEEDNEDEEDDDSDDDSDDDIEDLDDEEDNEDEELKDSGEEDEDERE